MGRNSRRLRMLHSAKRITLTEDDLEKLIHGEVLADKKIATVPTQVVFFKPKEMKMADMKSELTKVLDKWDKHEDEIRTPPKEKISVMTKPHRFRTINNVSRETFNYVRDNPMQQRKQIIEALILRGFKSSSVDALLAQMLRIGSIARSANGEYMAKFTEFQPIKAKARSAKLQPSAGITALPPKGGSKHIKEGYKFIEHAPEAPAKTSIVLNRGWTPDKAIENLNVMQARALYDKLKTIFGA